MRITTLCGVALAAALGTSPVAAADKDGNYAVWGTGARSCNQYLRAEETGLYDEFKAYAFGYITAYNTFTPETYRILPGLKAAALMDWLTQYCEVTPVDSFERALKQMMEHHHPARQGTAPGGGGW